MLLRRLFILALLIASGSFLTGCTSFWTETNPPQAWTSSRFKEVQEEDKQRLLGEDRSKSDVGDVLTYVPRKLWAGVEWTWNISTGNSPYKYAKQLFDHNPDTRREAIYVVSDQSWGRKEPYTKYYAHMAADDIDPTVRAAAIRALNRSRATAFTDVYTKTLIVPPNLTAAEKSEWIRKNEWTRVEAVKALANMPSNQDAAGVSKLLKEILKDEEHQQSRDIRIAAADALREYHQSDVAQALIGVLDDSDFGVAWQARTSLNLMTGKDYKYDAAAWLDYLTKNEKPFAGAGAG